MVWLVKLNNIITRGHNKKKNIYLSRIKYLFDTKEEMVLWRAFRNKKVKKKKYRNIFNTVIL